MSSPILYIGDEVSAAAFRLAGVRVQVPAAQDLAAALAGALGDADLILVSAGAAAKLPSAERERLLSSVRPAVVVIPDLQGMPVADLAERVRRQLGVLE